MTTIKLSKNNDKTEILLSGTIFKLNSLQTKSPKLATETIEISHES